MECRDALEGVATFASTRERAIAQVAGASGSETRTDGQDGSRAADAMCGRRAPMFSALQVNTQDDDARMWAVLSARAAT